MSLKVTTSQISFDVSNVKEKSSQWARPFRMRESSTDCLALVLYVLGILAQSAFGSKGPSVKSASLVPGPGNGSLEMLGPPSASAGSSRCLVRF
jgi:hypothetical protein